MRNKKELFEEWAKAAKLVLTPAPEGCVWKDYHNGVTQACWDAWKMSAAAASCPVTRQLTLLSELANLITVGASGPVTVVFLSKDEVQVTVDGNVPTIYDLVSFREEFDG